MKKPTADNIGRDKQRARDAEFRSWPDRERKTIRDAEDARKAAAEERR